MSTEPSSEKQSVAGLPLSSENEAGSPVVPGSDVFLAPVLTQPEHETSVSTEKLPPLHHLGPNLRYGGFWLRVGAGLIDLLIYIPLAILGKYLVFSGTGFGGGAQPAEFSLLWLMDNAVQYGLAFAMTVLCWLKFKGTPGKLALNLRVVDATTGNTLTFRQAALRFGGYFPSFYFFCLGLFWVGWDSRKQGWHDKMANTVVIVDKDRPSAR